MRILISLTLCLAVSVCFAAPFSVQESGWCEIGPNDTYAGVDGRPGYTNNYSAAISTHNSAQVGNPVTGYPLAYMILMYFDLSAYAGAGQVFSGNVEMKLGQNWGEAGPAPYRLFTVVSNWNEVATTWENFIGPGSTNNNPPYGSYPNNNQTYTNVFGEEISLLQCYGTAANGAGTNTFVIDGSKINYWLANHSDNLGIALVPQWYGNMMWCNRNRNWQQDRIPTLSGEIVPEPVFLPLLAGLGFLAYRRMR